MKAMQFLSKALVNNDFHLFKFLMILGRLLYYKWMPDVRRSRGCALFKAFGHGTTTKQ